MIDAAPTLELALRGLAIGAQLALGLVLARSARAPSLRIATALFIASNLAYLLNGSAPMRHLLGPAREALWFAQIGSAGLFWLFAATLFEDRPLSPRAFAPAGGLIALGLVARLSPPTVNPWLWTAHNLVGLSIALHALLLILRSGRVDLVEDRRRLRVPFVAVAACYSALLSAAQIGELAGFTARWYGIADAAAQAMLGLAGTAVLLEARAALFGRAEPPQAAPVGDPDAVWLKRLAAIMDAEALWRREGLTIGSLADAVGLPEHRLRRLINNRLGHRNFPAYVNNFRITAAEATLADPGSGVRTVASIAYDLGFGSLGPFNRAFRDATGLTPTDYRHRVLAESLPNPENLR
jgi:AraC-like DNA-binding protein